MMPIFIKVINNYVLAQMILPIYCETQTLFLTISSPTNAVASVSFNWDFSALVFCISKMR